MLRPFSAFLAMFCLLGLIVQLDGLAQLFGGAALILFAIDLLLTTLSNGTHVSRTRVGHLR